MPSRDVKLAKLQAPEYRVMVCGPRDFPSKFRVYCVVFPLCIRLFNEGYNTTVVYGGAKGVDTYAALAAKAAGANTELHLPDWDRYKKRAGLVRNDEMLDSGLNLVVAIGYGRGTAHAIKGAQERGIELMLRSQWWIGASAR